MGQPGDSSRVQWVLDHLVGRSNASIQSIPTTSSARFAELHVITELGDHAAAVHIVADDGTVFWIEETVTNLVYYLDVEYVVGNVRNITERKQHEHAEEN